MIRPAMLSIALSSYAFAQSSQARDTAQAKPLAGVTVTATRTARTTFDTPLPVTLVDSARLAKSLGNGVADVLRDMPGLDASGVGPNQRRPEIRGQRGQRVLLLSDGLRINNSRRQSDFGELPAIAGLSSVKSAEVVRGPSSVLYGTDAIGGVVNLIPGGIPASLASGEVSGAVRYRYGSVGASSMPDVMAATRVSRLGVRVDLAARDASAYTAPSGKFGKINFANSEPVFDSGIRDHSGRVALTYGLGRGEIFATGEMYGARDAGFGYVNPARLGAGQPTIQIRYPDQDYTRYTAGYRAGGLSLPFANRIDVATYFQRNFRHLNQFILVPAGPTATITTKTFNFTDLGTLGARVELAKTFGGSTLTYGLDAFRDKSRNKDTSETVIVGFGPTQTQSSNVPSVPNATFASAGAFAQLEFHPLSRLTTVVGTRAQAMSSETKATPNVTAPATSTSDRTAVWSVNTLYALTSDLNLVATVGRGFRTPNLVESFFSGPTPEGNATMRRNASLAAERSINVDAGLRLRRSVVYGEAFVYRNTIDDAIRAVATGNTVGGLPEYENRNVGKLRVDGLEMLGGVRPWRALDANVSWTRIVGKNISSPGSPIGDSYSSKIVGDASYAFFRDRVDVGYTVRYQGEQKDVIVGTNPIGSVLPSFTVHAARAGAKLMQRGSLASRIDIRVDNIGNTLYAEFPNASFFRPEPGRSFTVALTTSF